MKCPTCGQCHRAVFYGCSAYRRKGSTVCSNSLSIPAEQFETAIIREVVETALRPAVVRELMAQVAQAAEPNDGEAEQLQREIDTVTGQIRRLTDALASSNAPGAVLDGIRQREQRRNDLERSLKAVQASASVADSGWQAQIPRTLADWRNLLRDPQEAEDARRVLRLLLSGKLRCMPRRTPVGDFYEFAGEGTLRGAFPRISESRWGRHSQCVIAAAVGALQQSVIPSSGPPGQCPSWSSRLGGEEALTQFQS